MPSISSENYPSTQVELVDLQWDQFEFAIVVLHVRRVKRGSPSTPPVGAELRALRRLQREQAPKSRSSSRSSEGRRLDRPASPG